MTSSLSQLRQKILPLGELGCSWGRGDHGSQGDHNMGSAPSYQGADPPHLRRGRPVTVTAINQLVTIGQGEWARPEIHPGRPFGNSGMQGWGPDWSIGLGSLQIVPSGSQDRRRQSYPQHVSTRTVLKWGSLPMGKEYMGNDGNRGLWVLLWPWQCSSPFKGQ